MRLRPVLMTSVATVAGHFPLTLVTGAGAAARNSIGIVIVAGMSIGTVFTLLVIPSIYVLIAKQHAGEEPGAIRSKVSLGSCPDTPGKAQPKAPAGLRQAPYCSNPAPDPPAGLPGDTP
jgi:predicted RND superfamily exporter protein